jgi:hypothetical protein
MSLPSERVEFHVSIVADQRSRRWLGENLLGDANAPEAALDDVLREMANTAGGALKRTALTENIVLTTGIPVTGSLARPTTAATPSWIVVLGEGAASIAIVGEVHTTQPVRIAAAKLNEGMVVTRDLRNAAGAVLLPAGTRLTSSMAERLVKSLGEGFIVEVALAS